MGTIVRLSDLSPTRQALVRLCQTIDYGEVLGLRVLNYEPIFNPPPTIVLDLRLDADRTGRQELQLTDFALSDEVRRLLDQFDEIRTGCVQRIEVRAGIPRRAVFEAKLTEAVR